MRTILGSALIILTLLTGFCPWRVSTAEARAERDPPILAARYTRGKIFKNAHISTCPSINHISTSQVYIGNDKMFFIGQDGYIHGCVRVGGTYNGGSWLTVSPSYSAAIFHSQPVGGLSGQKAAKNSLIASPDGSKLFYIGMDGHVHGFIIHTIWDYEYFDFMKSELDAALIIADSCLIYPMSDRLYFVSKELANGEFRLRGFAFYGGVWNVISPPWEATSKHSQSWYGQIQPGGALTYDSTTPLHRIYYRNSNGYLAYYKVYNLTDYEQVSCPGCLLLHDQHLKIQGNLAIHGNRVYFAAHSSDNDSIRIYCLTENSSDWTLESLAKSAAFNYSQGVGTQTQASIDGLVSISPDGTTIAYMGFYPFVYYYTFDGAKYRWGGTNPTAEKVGDICLQFLGNNDIYYIASSNMYDGRIHHLKWQQDFCNNTSVTSQE